MWVRPCASVLTFGLSVGPAFVVSEVVAPAPAFVPVELLSFESVLVLAPGVALPAPMFAFAPALVPVDALPLAFVSVLVLWAAAIWLKETASKPEKSTGKNLRIWFLQGLGVEIQKT